MSMTSITLWRSEIGNFYNCSHNVRGIKSHSLSFDIDFCSIQRVLTFFGIFFSELMNINLIFMQRLIIILMTNLLYSRFRKYFRVYYYFHTNCILFLTASVYVHNFYLYFILLMRSGDINPNPGPRSSTWECLSICHWNLNSLSSHNFIKKDLLTAFNSIHKFDIICLSETFLNSTYESDNHDLDIPSYTLVRADHPSDSKRGGVCVYYKSSLPIIVLNISTLSECIILELSFNNKKLLFSTLYRSPSQSTEDFESFLENFEQVLLQMNNRDPFLTSVLGDFNAKSSNWWSGDNTSHEGLQIDSLTSFYGLHQIISEPTHILNNTSSCIDLIFTSQPNLVSNSGVYSSLHNNCHHNIIYAKFNLKIEYPPPYERLVWNYSKADITSIQKSASQFNWENSFMYLTLDEKIDLFNSTLLNIFSNYCPSKTIACDDSEPPWLSDDIKTMIKEKDNAFIQYQRSSKNILETETFKEIVHTLTEQIEKAKINYYSNLSEQLNNPLTGKKRYWTILKTLLNGKKVPIIPPINKGNCFITDFKEKAEAFNDFFSKQCTPVDNGSYLPSDIDSITFQTLSGVVFSSNDIHNIIKSLDTSKAHGYDGISIRMIKIFGASICKPLEILYRHCLDIHTFPKCWKKANVIPIHKKDEKNLLKNYRPISLLPVFSKIFERLIFNSIYNYLLTNKLLSPYQSGFKPGDSCSNQLISITHEILSSFDNYKSFETRGVFLDMSKAFDKVWHEGLIYKLKSFGISGNLLSLLNNFLSERFQRVVLNGQTSEWRIIKAGVPQGSILGPLLFLIYVNDIPDNLTSNVKLFADDVSLFSIVKDPIRSGAELNNDLKLIQKWAYDWKMSFNPDPNKQATEVLFSKKRSNVLHPDLEFNGLKIPRISSQKHLGMILDEKLSFNEHISVKLSIAKKSVGILRKLFYLIPRKSLIIIYKSFIRPHLDYCDIIYDRPSTDSFTSIIESIQYNAACAITGAIKGSSKEKLYEELGLERLSARRWTRRLTTFYKILSSKGPGYLHSLIPGINDFPITRSQANIQQFFTRTEAFKNSFFPYVIQEWNNLDITLRNSSSISIFKNSILKLVRPKGNSVFSVHNPVGIKFLNRLRLGLSHLREHKFKHNFQDCLDPICNCRIEIESTIHFFLHCPNFTQERQILLNNLMNIDQNLVNNHDHILVNILLFGAPFFDNIVNSLILLSTIDYILSTKRFDHDFM